MHHFTRSKNGGCLAALITAVITILNIMILLELQKCSNRDYDEEGWEQQLSMAWGLESLSFFFIWEFQNYFVYSQP